MRWFWRMTGTALAGFVITAANCILQAGHEQDARAARASAAQPLAGSWSTLPEPHPIGSVPGAVYYSFSLPNGSQAYLVVVDYKHGRWRIRPVVSEPATAPTSVLATAVDATAAVNGGYFNLHDGGHSTSYIVTNEKLAADPLQNTALLSNPMLKPFIARICNRSEVRFLKDKAGEPFIEIVRHDAPLPAGTTLVDSLQAGPQLLPTVESVDEAFIRTNPDGKDVDAISALKDAARTAFGITNDGFAIMLCVAGKGQDPESSGISLEALSRLMRRLGCVQALNLDGGASTTMYVRFGAAGTPGTVVCGKKPETLVKSALILESLQ